ncbi:MAG TPA: transcription elongation factor GreA [Anaerolineales bacterium]|nr:transcription elongation factor GreA [Anaerolineales bacterium]
MAETYLTSEGAAKLKAELEELTTTKRTELAARLREAIKMGDLSENADYIMAKEQQAFLEGRIQELQLVLRTATIVHNGKGVAEIAGVGNRVTVQEPGEDPETFTLVGAKEASPREGKISNESPIGQALMGRRVGETAEAQTPNGTIKFKILKIE